MGHFARLSDDNIVIQVIALNNAELLDENGVESEAKGIAFCQDIFGANTTWLQSSFNAATNGFRGKHANAGDTYDAATDKFVAPPNPVDQT